MVFSSNLFVFGFILIFFALYYSAPANWRNSILALGSVAFYTFGSGLIVWVLLFSILFNHVLGIAIGGATNGKRHVLFATSVVVNVGFLLYYKYATFFIAALSGLLHLQLPPTLVDHAMELPIGISFYTFQAVSYTADIYMRHTRPALRLVDFAAYHTLFPQLIAGPIVRYSEVAHSILVRPLSLEATAYGISRFSLGLAKKILIADPMGTIADHVFDGGPGSSGAAWVGAIAYTLQIYFDFSGYSDMAIGLGNMLGFKFPEHFDQPYRAESITEFWRRWHMTLSRWFRDYVYIPLGGNQYGQLTTYRNLFCVFFLCGLWHGAGWTFVIWGLYHGLLLTAERILWTRFGLRGKGVIGIAITFFLTVIGWIIFRSKSIDDASGYMLMMTGLFEPVGSPDTNLAALLTPDKLVVLLVGLVCVWFPWERLPSANASAAGQLAQYGGSFLLLIAALVTMSTATFNPFIYFRF